MSKGTRVSPDGKLVEYMLKEVKLGDAEFLKLPKEHLENGEVGVHVELQLRWLPRRPANMQPTTRIGIEDEVENHNFLASYLHQDGQDMSIVAHLFLSVDEAHVVEKQDGRTTTATAWLATS